MKILSWEEFGSGQSLGTPVAAAIGVFDGLHIGHRELVGRVLRREGLSSMIVTFAENPKRFFAPSTFHGVLSTLDQRLSLIASSGVHLCVLIDFSGDFSKLPGRQFLSMLRGSCDLRFLAVGSDFRCGYRLDTDAEGIKQFCAEHSIGVELLGSVHWAGHPVSSSRIRKAILEGRLEDAASMLGRYYEIDLRASRNLPSGRVLPTGGQAIPPAGLYEAAVSYAAELSAGAAQVVAELGSDGSWLISNTGAAGLSESSPVGLRLVRMVSRE
ncbi:MAG: FAD synthetase family protein [Rectinemataceae bacterium]|jgi:riboflavin kinase/FMN adenylyltransferase